MTRIINTELNNLNRDFYKFQTKVIKSNKQNNAAFISSLCKYQKLYKKAGSENNFVENLDSFAEIMKKAGIENLPGIIYSTLVKLPFITPEAREMYALKGLNYAEQQGDSIHTLARLSNLEILYKQAGRARAHAHLNILLRKVGVLTEICNNFENAVEGYKTFNKKHRTLTDYKLELARTRVGIAKSMKNTSPKHAIYELEKAREILKHENKQKEVDFVDLMLSQIKISLIEQNK